MYLRMYTYVAACYQWKTTLVIASYMPHSHDTSSKISFSVPPYCHQADFFKIQIFAAVQLI